MSLKCSWYVQQVYSFSESPAPPETKRRQRSAVFPHQASVSGNHVSRGGRFSRKSHVIQSETHWFMGSVTVRRERWLILTFLKWNMWLRGKIRAWNIWLLLKKHSSFQTDMRGWYPINPNLLWTFITGGGFQVQVPHSAKYDLKWAGPVK